MSWMCDDDSVWCLDDVYKKKLKQFEEWNETNHLRWSSFTCKWMRMVIMLMMVYDQQQQQKWKKSKSYWDII